MKKKFLLLFVLFLTYSFCGFAQEAYLLKLVKQNDNLLSSLNDIELLITSKTKSGELIPEASKDYSNRIMELMRNTNSRQRILLEYKGLTARLLSRLEEHKQIRSIEEKSRNFVEEYEADRKIAMAIRDVLNLSALFDYKKLAYFAPTQYLIPDSIRPKARKVYSPITDTMLAISRRYPDINWRMNVICTGYSDDMQTPKSSPLYKEMCKRVGVLELNQSQINRAMAFQRGRDLTKLMEELFTDYVLQLPRNKSVEFVTINDDKQVGYPFKNRTYQKIDENRRVVKVYWYMLPK